MARAHSLENQALATLKSKIACVLAVRALQIDYPTILT